MKYQTIDSGKRQNFKSGMERDTDEGKPRYDLIFPKGLPIEDSLIYRWAMLMQRGKTKYGERNWEKADSQEELDRFKSSAFRHFMDWYFGDNEEDHASAVFFNIGAVEFVKFKLKEDKK